jgi:HEAT repeat protein
MVRKPQRQDDPRSTEELIADAVARTRREYADPPEDEEDVKSYEPLAILHARGTREVLDAALALCDSKDPIERGVGANILGQLGDGDRTFPEECCDRLLRLLTDEQDLYVLRRVIFAFGHLGNLRAEPELVKFKNHADHIMRYGVAFSLAGTTHPEAVKALLELMRDPYEQARDWATTSIGGTLELDGPEIREALLERASDEDIFTRAEAHLGLARRRDERLLPYLIAELKELLDPSDDERDDRVDYEFCNAAKIYLGLDEELKISAEELLATLQRGEIRHADP